MAKVKVRVLNAVVDGKGHGSELSIDESSANALLANGYVELLSEKAEATSDKQESAPTEDAPKPKSTKAKKK